MDFVTVAATWRRFYRPGEASNTEFVSVTLTYLQSGAPGAAVSLDGLPGGRRLSAAQSSSSYSSSVSAVPPTRS